LKKPLLKDGCPVLDIKADQLLRRIGLALIAGGSNANGDDSTRGGTRNQVIGLLRWFTNALLQGLENDCGDDPSDSAAVNGAGAAMTTALPKRTFGLTPWLWRLAP
jgi:hypothetical protein